MKVAREEAVALFISLAYKNAKKWKDKELQDHLDKFDKKVDDSDVESLEDEDQKGLAKRILGALDAEDSVELVTDEVGGSEEDEGPPKKGNKGKRKAVTASKKGKEGSKTNPDKKKRVAVSADKFGNREGTQGATINAVIGSKPKSAEDIAEAVDLPVNRIRGHMQHLIKKGVVVKSEKGYAAKSGKK